MSLPSESEGSDAAAVCAYLGLVDDSDLHATYATEAHRCYCLATPTRIANQHQESFCLTAEHSACPVFMGEGVEATQTEAASASAPEDADEGGMGMEEGAEGGGPSAAAAAQPPSFSPPASQRWNQPRGLRRPMLEGELSMRVATVSLFVIAAIVVAVAFVVNRQIGDDEAAPVAPAATETPAATATPTPAPTEAPTATPTPAPTEEPTPAPTEPPATEVPIAGVYTIQAGDTCSGIAIANDVSLAALLAANEMTEDDCLTIQPGQELIIP